MKRLLLALVFLGFLASPSQAGNPTATVEFLDVGQGEAILIRSPEGKAALIDAGPSGDVVSLLHRRGIESLDLVAISHHHADHYGGMEAVIRAFHPRFFLATNSPLTTPHYLKLLRAVQETGMRAMVPTDAPRRVELGSVLLTILPLPPIDPDPDDENDNSIGIRVQLGDFSALLTGDSEAHERAYWEKEVPDLVRECEVLKLAHHGSQNGTDASWLALVRPRLAVASLGIDNEFGHPNPEVSGLLREFRIPLMRTDRDGTICVATDGERWGVSRIEDTIRGPTLACEPRGRPRRLLSTPTHPIDLNTASLDDLDRLPGIGPVLARRIFEGKPYATVDDLRRVKDIGAKRLEQIRPYVMAK